MLRSRLARLLQQPFLALLSEALLALRPVVDRALPPRIVALGAIHVVLAGPEDIGCSAAADVRVGFGFASCRAVINLVS